MQRAAVERGEVEQAMKVNQDGPMMTPPDRISEPLLGIAAYVKPSVGLQLLRQEILGPDAFDDAFRTYITRWAYKHPAPADFFRTMEDASGHRLDWFWREWFVENPHFDQAIDAVRHGSVRATRTRCSWRTAIARAACCRFARASR